MLQHIPCLFVVSVVLFCLDALIFQFILFLVSFFFLLATAFVVLISYSFGYMYAS